MSQNREKSDESASFKRLVLLRGPNSGKIFKLEVGSNLVGRWDPDTGAFPEVDLEQDDVDAKISRKHAVIDCLKDKTTIQDIGSLNGTFINRGSRLEHNVVYELKPGDEIIIGKTFLRFEVEK